MKRMSDDAVLKSIHAGARYESGESLESILDGTWVSEYSARKFMTRYGHKRPKTNLTPKMRQAHVLCMSRFGVPIPVIMDVTGYSKVSIVKIRSAHRIHKKRWTPKIQQDPTATAIHQSKAHL